MPALPELQAAFRAALLRDEARAGTGAVRADAPGAEARLAIYRHHVFTSLTAALASTYPVVARLVDPRFFRYAADRYIRQEPPAGPCLFEYGATFPDFLAGFPPARALAYLPDVARLEWALNVALHARDAAVVTPEALRALAPVTLHPSVTLLDSPWPVDAIWRASQAGAPPAPVALDAGGVRLQAWRSGDEVVFRPLAAEELAFREALARTRRLDAAAEAALAVEPAADLVALVRGLLDEQTLVAA
jgi:hypothetical protein